jgi:DNA polymerase III epsilon subunit-like protein
MIINHWRPEFTKLYGHYFPESYLCWDTEYTGGNREKDLIMEIGHCMVEDRQVVDRLNIVLDWSQHPEVPEDWLRRRLNHQRLQMGDRWRVTWEVMKEEGIHPVKALQFYYKLFRTWSKRQLPFVAHNGYQADERMFSGNVEGFLVKRWQFGDNELIDSGAIHKASLLLDSVDPKHIDLKPRVLPKAGDTMRTYFKRVCHTPAKGVYWKMLDCLQYYNLDEAHHLDLDQLHNAEYDSYCCHLLMEEYRSRVTHNNSGESGIATSEEFARMFEEEMASSKLETEQKTRSVQRFENQAAETKVDPEARKRLKQRRSGPRKRRRGQRPL